MVFMPEIMDKSILKALSTDTRQEIIKLLARRPYTASELSAILNKHVTTVTEHLDVLEKSGLIKRKESTNKWIYYTLSDKGERIFKPTYYSWVIVLSISVLCLLIGTQQLMVSPVMFSAGASAELFEEDNKEMVPLAQISSNETSTNTTSTTETTIIETANDAYETRLIIGSLLVAAAVSGFSFLIIRKIRK